ncbi:MAG: exodeoxyribonuclease III [Candidatus Komeilibacteria bacterium]
MKIISWNVNGIRAIQKKGFLDWFKKQKAGIICIQETKAQIDQLDDSLVNIPGYVSFFNSAERKGYSGVAIWTKEKPLKVVMKMGSKDLDNEGRLLQLDFKKFTLLNVYFPNGGQGDHRLQYKMEFYDKFLKHINKLKKQGKKIVFCGDVNTAHQEIDLARPKENENNTGFLPEERAWLDKVIANDYLDTFRIFNSKGNNYTWWDYKTRARERNVGWRIDYFFISKNLKSKITKASIHNKVIGSDHCPISIELNI